MNFSVGPLTARPATSGLTAITGAPAAAIASRMPGTERIGPIEITGLEGPTTIASAAASASRTSGVGRARSRPSNLDSLDRRLRPVDDQELLQPAPAVRGRGRGCATGCSHIGSTAARTPSARAICPWAAVSVPPSAMKWVR